MQIRAAVLNVKIKANLTLGEAMKPRGGIEVKRNSYFDLGDRWEWLVNATPRLLYLPGKRNGTHCTGC
jgi:hypothetical protein